MSGYSLQQTALLFGIVVKSSVAPLCPAGLIPQGNGACIYCPPGTYSLAGAISCLLCNEGRYGGAAGLTTPECSGPCPGCPAGTANPPQTSSLLCATNNARALPSALGMRLWPAAHPQNPQNVDLIVAPDVECRARLGVLSCADVTGLASIAMDGITRYVVGTAAEMNMEPAEELTCKS